VATWEDGVPPSFATLVRAAKVRGAEEVERGGLKKCMAALCVVKTTTGEAYAVVVTLTTINFLRCQLDNIVKT
jgi:hypothetical protein